VTPNLILLEVRLRKALVNLEKLAEELKTITRMRENKFNSIRIRACASILHDFYSGIEKMFINIAKEIDRTVPRGEGWHRELLEQMTLDIPSKRPAVISLELAALLHQYMGFRHRFRNLYGYELEWGKMEELFSNMDSTLNQLKNSTENFLEVLAQIVE